jgi:hypothetical protein
MIAGRAIAAAALFLAALGHASAGPVYSVTFDTSDFDTSSNPYQLDVNLTASNGVGDASSVTLDNFSCSGCPGTAQTLIDSTFTQDLYIPFTAGGTVAFDLTLAPDLTYLSADGPDSFQLSILDQFDNPVTTTDPLDAVLFASFDSDSPTVDSFGSPAGGDPAFAAPVVEVVTSTPEPNSAVLMAAAACFLGIWLRLYRWWSMPPAFFPVDENHPSRWQDHQRYSVSSCPSHRRQEFRCVTILQVE